MYRAKPFPVEWTNRKNLLHKEPSVINEKMIREALHKMLPKGEEGKYARQAGVDPRKVKHLLIEFQTISQIAHLSHMTSLTKLQLCNNVIIKIERLDDLVNLVYLDLSFNSIRKIEGLDKLRNLKFINFHRNLITTLENMDNQLKLEIFIISTNALDNLENVKYLRRFVSLSAVCLDGNPFCSDPNFRAWVIAVIPDLSLLDYYHVGFGEKQKAVAQYKTQLDKLIEVEDKVRRRASVVEAEEATREVLKKAFVEGYEENDIWNALFENDTEGKLLLTISDIEDVQVTYRELFRRASVDIYEKGMRAYQLRENEYEAFNTAIGELKDEVKAYARGITEEFADWYRVAILDLRSLVVQLEDVERRFNTTNPKKLPQEYHDLNEDLNKAVVEFVRRLHKVWYNVMTAEINMNEQLIEVGGELDRSVRELMTGWLEQVRGLFSALRDVQSQFNDRVVETLLTYGEFRASDTRIPANLRALVTDKDALGAAIQLSNEHHGLVIDQKEDAMVSNLKRWLEGAMVGIRTKEVVRSRMRISEISHFTDTHRGYLDDQHITTHVNCYLPDVRADQDYAPSEEEIFENKQARRQYLKDRAHSKK